MKKGILMIMGFSLILFLIDWEWVSHLRQEDLQYFTEGGMGDLGYSLLFITFPLMLLQGIITFFPILILILIHFIYFGLLEGFIFNLMGTTLSSLACYWLTKSFSGLWIDKFWKKRRMKLDRILKSINEYGILIIVILRSVPFFPSNIISIAAAISPIQFKAYFWSTIWGNISMIWLLSLLATPFWLGEGMFLPYLLTYITYLTFVLTYYGIRYRFPRDVIKSPGINLE